MTTIEQLGKASRRSAIVSLLGFLVIIFSLAYSSYHLYSLQQASALMEASIQDMEKRKIALQHELEEKQKLIDDVNKKLAVSNKVLFEIGASGNTGLVTKAIDDVIENNPKAADIAPRVYMHIRRAQQREPAKKIGIQLQSAGYIVPGVEILVNKGPEVTQLRYFRDEDDTEAKKILSVLAAQNIGTVTLERMKGYENSTAIRPRHFEIWFAPAFAN